jgi:hypothetical protein
MDTRPVWVSEEHAAYIDRYLGGFKARWDAAPADAAEVVDARLRQLYGFGEGFAPGDSEAVLRALGYLE